MIIMLSRLLLKKEPSSFIGAWLMKWGKRKPITYIISNLPLEKQYVSEQHEKPEAWDALLRRINCVRVFDLDGSHKDYTVHEYFHPCTTPTFEQIEIDDCPF